MTAFYNVALDLPHAGTVATRIVRFIEFECLELGEEGAEISLRAGEDPNSIQRPV